MTWEEVESRDKDAESGRRKAKKSRRPKDELAPLIHASGDLPPILLVAGDCDIRTERALWGKRAVVRRRCAAPPAKRTSWCPGPDSNRYFLSES